MTECGKELALGLTGPLGLGSGGTFAFQQGLAFSLQPLERVDVRAGAEPLCDRAALVADGQRPTERPAVLTAAVAQPVLDLVRLAAGERMPPCSPCTALILGVKH